MNVELYGTGTRCPPRFARGAAVCYYSLPGECSPWPSKPGTPRISTLSPSVRMLSPTGRPSSAAGPWNADLAQQRSRTRNPSFKKTRIPTAGSVFLKCPFNGKAGPLILDSRHDDSGAPRSIFTEKPGKHAFRPSCLPALQTQRAPNDTGVNAGKRRE